MACVGIPARGVVLDVGTGTGTAALLALEAAPGSMLVGIDPSVERLQLARGKGLRWVVAGLTPGLPHAAGIFHRVLGNFVLSHCTCYKTALADMVRVLQAGGRLGVTAWGPSRSNMRRLWQEEA